MTVVKINVLGHKVYLVFWNKQIGAELKIFKSIISYQIMVR